MDPEVTCRKCGRPFSTRRARKLPNHNTRVSVGFGTRWRVSSEKCNGSGADVLPLLIEDAESALQGAEQHKKFVQEIIVRENERLNAANEREVRCRETLAKLKARKESGG